MRNVRSRMIWLTILLITTLLTSCAPKSTPPGANSIYSSVDPTHFSYHYWTEGLAILVWHDFTSGGEGCTGTGSTEDPVYRLICDVSSADGESFSWRVQTEDGVTTEMWIDDQRYDPARGNLFLVHAQDGVLQVEQYPRDFSTLDPSVEAVSALSTSDPDVASFIDRLHSESD